MEAAEFADSGETKIGDPIIALSAGYVSFGMVTAQPYLYLCDGSYQRINTDIIGKNENGGILMNLDGQVVGILGPDTKNADSSTLNGVGISEIGGLVNALASRTSLPYFGILGKDVTDALSKELNMPKGVIVMQVEEGSPAMENGIQATDVITSLDGQRGGIHAGLYGHPTGQEAGSTISVSLWRKGKERVQRDKGKYYTGKTLNIERRGKRMKYIETLREGEKLGDIYLCKSRQSALTKSGKSYENVILQDKTGTLDAKIWDPGSPGIGDFDALDYVYVVGDVTSFQGSLQLSIKRATRRRRESTIRRIIFP